MTDLASVIRRVEPRSTAKLLARDLGISLRHAKRFIAGEIPTSRNEEVCRWLAARVDRKLAELEEIHRDLKNFSSSAGTGSA